MSPNTVAFRQIESQTRALIGSGPDSCPPSPGPDGSWKDIDYRNLHPSAWPARAHLERTRGLALAGKTQDALSAVHWWLAHDPLSSNWWHNQIGTPRFLAETLLVLSPNVPPDMLNRSRVIFERSGDFVLQQDGVTRRQKCWTGANRLWIATNQFLAGLLYKECDRIGKAVSSAMEAVHLAAPGEEGIQVDGSFHQHGPLLYNGAYGESFLEESCFFVAAAKGTPWQPEPPIQHILTDLLLDGTRWMLRGDTINPGALDRVMTRRGTKSLKSLEFAAKTLADAGTYRNPELNDLVHAITRKKAPGTLTGNRMFFRSDFMVQNEAEVQLSVRMHSTRTRRAECCNGEGLLSHHVADGLTYLTRNGSEYSGIFPVWDWQKLPGTTCVQTPHPEPWQLVTSKGASTGVGGVSDGRWGACTQHLLTTCHTVHKSWFFGPGAMACLGAELHSAHESVVTTMDQCLIQGTVECDVFAGPLPPGNHRLRGVRWLKHGPWTTLFPRPTDLNVELGSRSAPWSRIGSGPSDPVTAEVFLAYQEHGPAPSGEGYAYIVIGSNPDRSQTEALSQNPPCQILKNSGVLQAVWWPDNKMLQVAAHLESTIPFHNGHRLQVDRECCLLLKKRGGGWEIHVAEPSQQGGEVSILLQDPEGAVLLERTVSFPTKEQAGRSLQIDGE